MRYTTLGATGLRVSLAGLGCGGFSRLGLAKGNTEEQAADVIRTALDLGVNYIDTAASYGTEGAVGLALRGRPRDDIVIASKVKIEVGGALVAEEEIYQSLDESLRLLRTDHIDVFQIHGPRPEHFAHVMDVFVPALQRAKRAGKIRFIGISEHAADIDHEVLLRGANAGIIDVALLAFHMMHQTAKNALFDTLGQRGVGSVAMYVVRRMFAQPDRLREVVAELVAAGKLPAALLQKSEPLDFLVHDGGAETLTEAAYRFAGHQDGIDVVLFGTSRPEHVRENVASLLKPPLPAADIAKINALFGELAGVGLDVHGMGEKGRVSATT